MAPILSKKAPETQLRLYHMIPHSGQTAPKLLAILATGPSNSYSPWLLFFRLHVLAHLFFLSAGPPACSYYPVMSPLAHVLLLLLLVSSNLSAQTFPDNMVNTQGGGVRGRRASPGIPKPVPLIPSRLLSVT